MKEDGGKISIGKKLENYNQKFHFLGGHSKVCGNDGCEEDASTFSDLLQHYSPVEKEYMISYQDTFIYQESSSELTIANLDQKTNWKVYVFDEMLYKSILASLYQQEGYEDYSVRDTNYGDLAEKTSDEKGLCVDKEEGKEISSIDVCKENLGKSWNDAINSDEVTKAPSWAECGTYKYDCKKTIITCQKGEAHYDIEFYDKKYEVKSLCRGEQECVNNYCFGSASSGNGGNNDN